MSDISVTVIEDVVHVVSTGLQGPTGPPGTIALANLAAWDPAVHYLAGAPVLRNNRVYIAAADNTGADPTGGGPWVLVDVETTEGAQAKVDGAAATLQARAEKGQPSGYMALGTTGRGVQPPKLHAGDHASAGADPITPAAIGAETPTGAQTKADGAVTGHVAAAPGHSAAHISVAPGAVVATDVQGAIAELVADITNQEAGDSAAVAAEVNARISGDTAVTGRVLAFSLVFGG